MAVQRITQVPNLSQITNKDGTLMVTWARFFNDVYQLLTGLSSTLMVGDASVAMEPRYFAQTYVWNSPLTGNRTLTISSGFPADGMRVRVVRTTSATGASTLTTSGSNMTNATVGTGQYADFEYSSSAAFWYQTAQGQAATILSPQYGGTGVANNSANTLTFSGNYGLTLALTNTTSVTLPTSGTLVNSAVAALSSLATVGNVTAGTVLSKILLGVTDGSDAAGGYIGEVISANSAAVTPGASGVAVNIASISLTAGDWDVEGFAVLSGSGMTGTSLGANISLASGGTDSITQGGLTQLYVSISNNNNIVPTGVRRINVTTTTTVYLTGFVIYTVLGSAVWANSSLIRARRVR